MIRTIGAATAALMLTAFAPPAVAQAAPGATPGYNQSIPPQIKTPDRVQTPIGVMHFTDGVPTRATVTALYDNLDLMRGVETFLSGVPATSLEAIRRGSLSMGADTSNKVLIFNKLMDANPLFLTGNAETVYAMAFLDLKKDGPTVVEVPVGSGPGTVNDAFFRFVVDMGGPGPDKGQGGKYLILPPDYTGDLDGPIGGKEAVISGQKYFVTKSTSYVNWLILRGFLVGGKTDAADKMYREGLKVYPLSQAANPPTMEFISGSGKSFNTIYANTFAFYEQLHTVIDREPVSFLDPELRGQFAAIGLEKGKPFAPDARMQKILIDAAAIGNATSRAIVFSSRLDGAVIYPGSAWRRPLIEGCGYQFLKAGARCLDSRTGFFYQATVNTPAMILKIPGLGSQYAEAVTDSHGDPLRGAKNYKLHLPANIPAKNFWSVVAYDPQTRSELQTSQPLPSKSSTRDKLTVNPDGSIDLYYGPKAPAGHEANWTQTIPGKGWFVLFRLYGPLDPWFDKTWRPGEFEPAR